MTEEKEHANNVIRFPVEGLRRFGFKRAKKRAKHAMEHKGQLSLFDTPATSGQVVLFPGQMGSFDEALLLDEHGDARAVDTYRRAIDEGDHVADAYCNLGIVECENRNTTGAFDCFARSLAEEPRHFEAHYNMANLYFEIGDLRLARSHYEIAASIEPEFPHVHFNLGLVHAMNEDIEAAIASLTTYRGLASGNDHRMADELLLMLRQSLAARPRHGR